MHIDDPIAYALWKLMMARGADTSTTHGATVRTSVSFLCILCATVYRTPTYVRLRGSVSPGLVWHPSPFSLLSGASVYIIYFILKNGPVAQPWQGGPGPGGRLVFFHRGYGFRENIKTLGGAYKRLRVLDFSSVQR